MIDIAWAGKSDPETRDAMALWAAEQLWPGQGKSFGNCVCMGVLDDGKPIACMVYHEFSPETGIIEISGASTDRRWLQRRVLKEMFAYPFEGVGVQMVVMRVSARRGQRHLHRMLKSYGFKAYHIPRLWGREEDGIIFTLTDDDWRENKFNSSKERACEQT